jgi:hypothetical protein
MISQRSSVRTFSGLAMMKGAQRAWIRVLKRALNIGRADSPFGLEMEETQKGVKPVGFSTLLLVAVMSVALTCFWDLFVVFLPGVAVCTQNVSTLIPTYMVDLMGGPFVMFLLMIPLMRIPLLRRRITTATLVYIYVTAMGVLLCMLVSPLDA